MRCRGDGQWLWEVCPQDRRGSLTGHRRFSMCGPVSASFWCFLSAPGYGLRCPCFWFSASCPGWGPEDTGALHMDLQQSTCFLLHTSPSPALWAHVTRLGICGVRSSSAFSSVFYQLLRSLLHRDCRVRATTKTKRKPRVTRLAANAPSMS